MYAHYFATKTTKFLIITNSPSIAAWDTNSNVMRVYVTGKTDARKQAAFWGAKPWNF